MPQPNKIPLAFAASGDKNTIPERTETTGLASWREGFPAITSVPFSEGGIAPKRADFNGILYALSQAVMWLQQGGVYAYDVNTDYEAGNVVLDAGGLYVANAANGPSSAVVQPSSDTTGATWKLVRLDLATPTAAGYMSAADKAALDTLLTYDSTSHAATPDYDNVVNETSFQYRTLGAMTLLRGYGKLLSATSGYSDRRVVSGLPVPAWGIQGNAYIYFDSSTYYGAWFSIDERGDGYITTRDVSIPANLMFGIFTMYPRAL